MTPDPPTLVLRADGGPEIGVGHLARAAAIAEMVGVDHAVAFYTRCRVPALTTMLAAHGRVVSLDDQRELQQEAVDLAGELTGRETVVLDGEQFDADYQATLRSRGCTVVCIDDRAARRFCADLIVNHAGGVCASAYRDIGDARLCLGPRYAMVRAPFLAAARAGGAREPNDNVFVSLGGADPDNRMPGVLAIASGLFPDHHFHLVVGAANRQASSLDDLVREQRSRATVHRNLSAGDMCALMQTCSTAITSASTVAMEYACVGGALYVVHTAADQARMHRGLIEGGMAWDLDRAKMEAGARDAMLIVQRRTFDGHSDARLRDAINDVARQ